MRRTLVSSKGFHAPRPSGGIAPSASSASSVSATPTPAAPSSAAPTRASEAPATPAAASRAKGKATATSHASSPSPASPSTASSARKSARKSSSLATNATNATPPTTHASTRGNTVSSMLAGRGGLSGHFSANHLRRGSLREEHSEGGPCALPPPSSMSKNASEGTGLLHAGGFTSAFASGRQGGEERDAEVTRKRSRSPPKDVSAPRPSTSASSCLAALDAAGEEPPQHDLLAPPLRATRRVYAHSTTANVPRTVFYPPPAELVVAPSPTWAESLQRHSEADVRSATPPHACAPQNANLSTSPAAPGREPASVDVMHTTANALAAAQETLSPPLFLSMLDPRDVPAPETRGDTSLFAEAMSANGKGESVPGSLVESGTDTTSTTTTTTATPQSGTWFLSALEHQQRGEQQQLVAASSFAPAALGSSPYSGPSLPSHTATSQLVSTPPAASLTFLPPPPLSLLDAPPPMDDHYVQQPQQLAAPPPQKVLTFSQASSSREHSLLRNSPAATPPSPPRQTSAGTVRTVGSPEKKADRLSDDEEGREKHRGFSGDVAGRLPANTEGLPSLLDAAAQRTLAPASATEMLHNVAQTAVAATVNPNAEEDQVESDEALEREMAEDLRLSTDVAFTPSGSGNGAPPLLSQSSLLHEGEEEETGEAVGNEEVHARMSTAASSLAQLESNGPLAAATTAWCGSQGTTIGVGAVHSAATTMSAIACQRDFSENTLNTLSTAPAAEAVPPPFSASSWPLYESPLSHLPGPLVSERAEQVQWSVAAAATAAAAGVSGKGSRHRTVFSFSSRKAGGDEGSSMASTSVPPPESPQLPPPLASCPSTKREGSEHTILIPPSFVTSSLPPLRGTEEWLPDEQIASTVPPLLVQPQDDFQQQQVVKEPALAEGVHSNQKAPGQEELQAATSTSSELHFAPVAPACGATAHTAADGSENEECVAAPHFAPPGCPPPPTPLVHDAPTLISASAVAPQVSASPQLPPSFSAHDSNVVSPLRLCAPAPTTTSTSVRPGRTCFTLHSTASTSAVALPSSAAAPGHAAAPSLLDSNSNNNNCNISNSNSNSVPPSLNNPDDVPLTETSVAVPAAARTTAIFDPAGMPRGLSVGALPPMPTHEYAAASLLPPTPPVLVDERAEDSKESAAAEAPPQIFLPCSACPEDSRAKPNFNVFSHVSSPQEASTTATVSTLPNAQSDFPDAGVRAAEPAIESLPPHTAPAISLCVDTNSLHQNQRDGQPLPAAMLPNTFYDLPLSMREFYATRRGVTKLYDWQHELLTQPEVRAGRNFIYSLPTSGGKTLVAELSLLRCVVNRRQSCFFVLPFVSLAEEKTLALQPLTTAFEFNVDGHYGSSGRFPLCDAPAIYVCTIEKANSLLNYMLEEGRTAEIGAVVVDELHMVGESRRGATLELFLSKLLMIDHAREAQRERVAAAAATAATQTQQRLVSDHADEEAEGLPEDEAYGYFPEEEDERTPAPAIHAETYVDPGPLQIIGMSATVPNLTTIAEWLHAACFERDFRPVPLRAYSVVGGLVLRDGQSNERNLSGGSVTQHLLELATEVPDASVLIFCASRQQCVDTARGIVHFLKTQAVAGQQLPALPGNSAGPQDAANAFGATFANVARQAAVSSVPSQASAAMKSLLADLAALAHYEASQLSEIVPHGVAFHHGGLLAEERELIEDAFRRKHIRILCSTSTLAAGVNLPARRVIIKTPYVGRDFLTKSRYLQMCGRAGRAGLDPYGESYLLLTRRDQSRGHALMHAAVEPCQSQILEDDQTLTRSLLECIGVGLVTDAVSARQWSASLLSRYAVGLVDASWRRHLLVSTSAAGSPSSPSSPSIDPVTAPQTAMSREASDNSRSVPAAPCVVPPAPLTAVPLDALSVMVRTSLHTLARCGLVAVTCPSHVEAEDEEGSRGLGGATASGTATTTTTTAAAAGAMEDVDLQVRVTPFGSSSVRSCFSVEEALLLREELNELRQTGLILSDDLHLCYFLTPLREVGECDWELLRLMMSRMSDCRQRIASLLGVDAYFIDQQAMGLGGPLQVTEEGRRRLFTAKRFYVALMLADVLAEVPMSVVEQRFNVNRGQLQNLMRSASMFSSSITSFCHAMEWYALEAVLSSFVKRLGFGVKPDLLPLMEIRGMQPARARALWNAGFKKLPAIAAADADDMVAKVKSMNPPESKSAKFFTKRSALMVIREAHLTLQSQIKEKKGELKELTLRGNVA